MGDRKNYLPLKGKAAIVTGASRGLGSAMAYELASQGANVLLTYTSPNSTNAIDSLIQKIASLQNGSRTSSIRADLRDPSSPDLIARAAVNLSPTHQISILVNNAGVEQTKALGAPITCEDFDDIYQLNVRGTLLLTQAVLPYLAPQGRIVNISSVGARCGFADLSLYCSSKAAIEGLTRVWAAELGHNGTTVNCVNPGPVQSDMLDHIPGKIIQMQKENTPVENRLGRLEEVARIVAWLAGPDASWVTGQAISASGGFAMY